MTSHTQPVDPRPDLEDILAEWLEAAQEGKLLRLEEYLRKYPQFEIELQEHWEDLRLIHSQKSLANETVTQGSNSADTFIEKQHVRGLADFEIEEELGKGGMGIVHKARQKSLDRFVAIKRLQKGWLSSEDRARQIREAKTMASVQHTNIVRIYEIGEENGQLFLCLEFIEGGSLDQRLRENPLKPKEAATLLLKLAHAVQLAHDNGILHRDLKPENVLMTREGEPKLTDFGLAKQIEDRGLSVAGSILGTPSYMSPEQANGEAATERSDVYGLGAVLYECLTGNPPFKGTSIQDTLNQVREKKPVPPSYVQTDISPKLEAICLMCLEKKPENRYENSAELTNDLTRFLNKEKVHAKPPDWWDFLNHDEIVHPREWGWLNIWGGLGILLIYSVVTWLLLNNCFENYHLFVGVGYCIFVVWLWIHSFWHIRYELTKREKHIMILWLGVILTIHLIPFAIASSFLDAILGVQHTVASLILALGFFVQASIWWGRFYYASAAFAILSIFLRHVPEWGALLVGSLFCVVCLVVGWNLLSRAENELTN